MRAVFPEGLRLPPPEIWISFIMQRFQILQQRICWFVFLGIKRIPDCGGAKQRGKARQKDKVLFNRALMRGQWDGLIRDKIQNPKSKVQNLRGLLVAFFTCCAFRVWAGEGPAGNAPKRAEFRLLDAERRMLLSRDGLPLAAAQLRPATPGESAPAKLVFSVAEAKAALQPHPGDEQRNAGVSPAM